jgi:hypothetical protein
VLSTLFKPHFILQYPPPRGGEKVNEVSHIEPGKYETVFYNLGIFNEEERIIIFPGTEFLRTYQETTYYLELMQKVLENALGPEPEFDPKIDFETLDVALD